MNIIISKMHNKKTGFALPTILIVSLIMLAVLLMAVSSTAAVRVSLDEQYYNQLARNASEAGIAYAKACLSTNNNIPQWTDGLPLMPNTDCGGFVQSVCPPSNIEKCVVDIDTDSNMQLSFIVKKPTVDVAGKATTISSTGTVDLLTKSGSTIWRSYKQNQFLVLGNY